MLWLFAIATTLLALACFGAEFVCRHLGLYGLDRLPYSGLTLIPESMYTDTWMFNVRFDHFHQSSFFDSRFGPHYLYPAPLSLFYRLLRFSPHPTTAMLTVLLVTYLGLGIWFARKLLEWGLSRWAAVLFSAIAVVFSYPFLFEFNRANMEIFVWGFSALGVLAFFRNRPWLAAALIGCAAACKVYPFIFLGLLFARKQYWQVVYSVVVATVINYFSFWAIAGSIPIGQAGVKAGLAEFQKQYILRYDPAVVGLDHSLFGFLKRFWPGVPAPTELAHILTVYLVVAVTVACALYFLRVIRLPAINQLVFLTVACLVLPPTSFDYTLLQLYTPWVMIVCVVMDAWRNNASPPRGLWPAMICFIVLMSPQNEFIIHGERIDGQIKCLTLLALAYISLRLPLQSELSA